MIKNLIKREKRTIQMVYDQYRIPENLRKHMLRTAACAKIILDNWKGKKLDQDRVLRVLLLHDLGNIAKIPETEITDELLLEIRRKYIEQYGRDDHLITRQMMKELHLEAEDLLLLDGKRSKENEETMNSASFERKICAYCDQRVSPEGVMGIQERLEDAKRRYQGKTQSVWSDEKKADHLIACALEIEKQIMKYCDRKPEEITEKCVEEKIEELREYEV